MKQIAMLFGLMSVVAGCAVTPVRSSTESVGTGPTDLPIVHQCSSRSSLQVGSYASQWANWSLSVDSSGFAYVTVTLDSGVTAEAHGGEPLAVRLPGDSVDFTVWTDGVRAHFVQPYPGLVNGYDDDVPCVR